MAVLLNFLKVPLLINFRLQVPCRKVLWLNRRPTAVTQQKAYDWWKHNLSFA
jgi:hypothetical protein